MTEKWEYGDPLKVLLLREKKTLGCWSCRFHRRKPKKLFRPNEPKMHCIHNVKGYPHMDRHTCTEFGEKVRKKNA